MTTLACVELLSELSLGRAPSVDLVEEVDAVELGGMILDFCKWSPMPGAADVLRSSTGSVAAAAASGSARAYVPDRLMPGLFLLALHRNDDSALDLAGRVDVIGLALLGLIVLTWWPVDPATRLETYALAQTFGREDHP